MKARYNRESRTWSRTSKAFRRSKNHHGLGSSGPPSGPACQFDWKTISFSTSFQPHLPEGISQVDHNQRCKQQAGNGLDDLGLSDSDFSTLVLIEPSTYNPSKNRVASRSSGGACSNDPAQACECISKPRGPCSRNRDFSLRAGLRQLSERVYLSPAARSFCRYASVRLPEL